MAELNPELEAHADAELKKKAEFLAQQTEAITHLAKLLEADFAKSAEGKEMVYLKNILEHYVDNDENFLTKFVSGKRGERGIDVMIAGIEHPESEIKPDSKLLAKLKRLSATLDKKKIPTTEEWNEFRYVEKYFREMKPLELSEFLDQFRGLLSRIKSKIDIYPDSDIKRLVQDNDYGKTPKWKTLKNLQLARLVWKLIVCNINMPKTHWPEEAGFKQKLVDLLDGVKDVKDLDEKSGLALLSGNEDVWVSDLDKFFTHVKSTKKKNPLIEALRKTGEEKTADALLVDLFHSKEGGADNTLKMISSHSKKLEDPENIQRLELEAAHEIAGLFDAMLKAKKKEIDDERLEFSKTLFDRVKELRKTHAKNLEFIEESKKKLAGLSKEILLGANITRDDLNRMSSLDQSRDENLRRVLDIMKIIDARQTLRKLQRGMIDDARFESDIEMIHSSSPTEFSAKTATQIKSLHDNLQSGTISIEQFNEHLKNIDIFINKLLEQLSPISANLSMIAKRSVTISTEYDDLNHETQYRVDSAYDEAMSDHRRASKVINLNEYREELGDNDWSYLSEKSA